MKKLGIILVLILFVNICVSAQIQRHFFDFTLGVTTKKEVVKYFKKLGKVPYKDNNGNQFVNNIKFGGHIWSFAAFSFYNDKLSRVYFADNDTDTPSQTLDIVWDTLQKNIIDKYSDYYLESMSKDDYKVYGDHQTVVVLKYDTFDGTKELSLMYDDRRLSKKEIEDSSNEL